MPKGRLYAVEATSSPILWDGKNAVQVVSAWYLPERKRAYDAIAELNRDRKTILDNMPAIIWFPTRKTISSG